MKKRIAITLRDPARRLDSAWTFIGVLVAGLCLYLGAVYLLGGDSPRQVTGWRVLARALPGGLRTHGAIVFLLGFALAVQLRATYTTVTLWVLRALRTYCFIAACCWIGSWIQYGVTWGAPAWWLFLAGLTVFLTIYAPPLEHRDNRVADADVAEDERV